MRFEEDGFRKRFHLHILDVRPPSSRSLCSSLRFTLTLPPPPSLLAFTIVRDFHKEGGWLFGVFDGHGGRGDEASNYVKDELPGCLIKELNKIQGKLSVEDYEEACLKGHVLCNDLLHASPVEDSLSGTTSISVLFHGTDYMTISNVGGEKGG